MKEEVEMKNLGQQIRMVRTQKGIGLNAFANQLGVSPGYLSNLETGKTETNQLSKLDKMQKELHLNPDFEENNGNELDLRIKRIHRLLKQLEVSHPQISNYFLTMVEQGIEVFLKENEPADNLY